jgi:hypothetical protein
MIDNCRGELVLSNISQKRLMPVHDIDQNFQYKLNSENYRTEEFNNIDWKNSIVVFGCSQVFGIGLTESETLTFYLSKLLKRPVINLGVSSSSMAFAFHNSILLSEGFPAPWAVIQVWTEISRQVYYATEGPVHHGSWNLEDHEFIRQWALDEYNVRTNGILLSLASRSLWKGKTKYIEASYFEETYKNLKCLELKTIDYARDSSHCGVKTNQSSAKKLMEELLKCK